MSAPEPWRCYEDLALDTPVESAAMAVSRDEMIAFASEYDPQYFHTDPDSAARDHQAFDDVVASGIHTMAIWRKLDHQLAHDIRWICGVAWEDVRWPHPLRPGDSVRARSTFLAKRVSTSRPDRGVVTCLYELVRDDDVVIWSCRGISLIERRG